ncbi:MAG: glycosyltransferase [Bacteroidales bacterium]|nr:glycosyltransferase [Bacteroidales bacterium]
MVLTIITINRNNAAGLEKTMQSVLSQMRKDFEYVVVDGASTDGSVSVIERLAPAFGDCLKWVSEPDKGIYNAMNKGIGMARGEYIQILNSGDSLVSQEVVEKMYTALEKAGRPSILYGNMLKDFPDGHVHRDKGFAGEDITLLGMYIGTLNHSPAYIRRSLFDKYGPYDESLKIDSDWKWYLQAIVFGEEKPVYADIDVTLFDMTGISETNTALTKAERALVLKELIPPTVLADYDAWVPSIRQMRRIKRHPWAYKIVWFLERVLFKLEKRKDKKING